MTEPALTLLLMASSLVAIAAVRFFKTLDTGLWDVWWTPLAAGLVSGIAMRLIGISHPAVMAIVLTIVALYVRLTGRESEPIDGMLLGAASAVAAAIPLVIHSEHALRILSECLLAGAVGGYGITFASFHVTDKARQVIIDVVTAAMAVLVAYIPTAVRHDRLVAIAAAVAVPLIAVVAVFRQWPDIRAELSHEASLGFINDRDVRRTAHPFLRLGSGGWADARAHREFVRLANKIALRKRQQRNRPDDIARLYQVEIIKLRMRIQEMSKIDRATLAAANGEERASDTIAAEGMRHE